MATLEEIRRRRLLALPVILPDSLGEARRRRLKSLPAFALDPFGDPGDALALTDAGEFEPAFPFSLIETQPEAFDLTGEGPSRNIPQGKAFTAKTLMLAEIELSTGTIFRAGKGVRHPLRFYTGKVRSFGSIIRSMPVPTGIPHIGDAEIVIDDKDRTLRSEADANSIMNREVTLKIGSEGESEEIFQVAYTGKIANATFTPGAAKLTLRDNTFQFFDQNLPDLLTTFNFAPDPLFARNLIQRTEGRFEEREIFGPIVFGVMNSDDFDTIGSINAVRLDSTTYNLAQHPIPHDPIRIFIKDPDNRPLPDSSFVELIGGFSIVEVEKTIEGVDYTFTHVVFGSARADGFEVRWDGEGITDDGTKDGTVVRNPATCILLYLTRIAQQSISDQIDVAAFFRVANQMDLVDTGGGATGFFCDGAITQRMTHQEALSRLTRSFGIFLFTNKDGLISIRYVNASDPDRIVMDDVQDIYLKSEVHTLAQPVFNQVDLQFARTFSDQNWNDRLVVTDPAAVTALGRTEKKDLKLFFVRDVFVANQVANDFLQFTAPKSYRIIFTVPGHRRTSDVELGQLIGITNYSGIDESGGGYENKEFLIHKTEFRTDSKQLRVHAVARAEPPGIGLELSTSLEFFGVTAADGFFEPGLWLELTGRPPRDGGFDNPTVLPFTPSWITIEVAQNFGGFPGVDFPTIGLLDFGVGVPGLITPILEGIAILIDARGVDAMAGRMYSFPYRGFKAGERLFVRARDNQIGPADSAPQTHDWFGDITLWR